MKIYLVRHGQTEWNKIGRIQGNLDVPLNDLGREEARRTAGLLSNIEFNCIYTSGLVRAIETADIMFPNHNGKLRYGDLNERCFGHWQGRLWSEIHAENPNLHEEWLQQGGNYRPPNGESLTEMISRSYSCLKEILRKHNNNESLLIVGHGGPIKGILGRIDGVEDGRIPDHYHLSNCGVSSVSYNGKLCIDFVNKII